MINVLKRLVSSKRTKPLRTTDIIEDLYGSRLTQKRKYPVPAPEHADDELRQFYVETEWLQPVFNRFICGEGFRFHEVDISHVTLGTYDGPDDGRTYEVSFGSVIVGEVAVVPKVFRLDDETDWADVRVKLAYPVELIDGKEVHGFLSGLIELTQAFELETWEAMRDDPRAGTRASQAMIEGMWDTAHELNAGYVIQLNVSGPWTRYKNIVAHWQSSGVDPWELWERKLDNDA